MINKQDCVIRILYKCVRSPSPNSGIIPVITPLSLTFCKIAASASPTKLSRSGDRGSPCLSPLYVLKYSPVSPFKLMGILPPLTTFSTQFIHLLLKPFLYSTSLKNFQLTLSYAFSISILKSTPISFLLLVSWMISCKHIIPVRMFLPLRKAVWALLINLSIKGSILMVTMTW